MLEIQAKNLIALCLRLEPFGSLEIDDGRVLWVRSFRCDEESLPGALETWQEGESVKVDRFPDGFKVRFSRLLATMLAGEDGDGRAADSGA